MSLSPEQPASRSGALAALAEEAARFAEPGPAEAPRAPVRRRPARPVPPAVPPAVQSPPPAAPAGYVPVAVAPERGNTRPALPVDGRLHMRVARPTLEALDAVVADWRSAEPVRLRDLERATLVRVGLALVLADIARHGRSGAVGEAVRAALDPAVRHTLEPLPDVGRWLRPAPDGADRRG